MIDKELEEDIEDITEDTDEILEDTNEILKRLIKSQEDILNAIKASKENKKWIIGLFMIDKIVIFLGFILLGSFL